MEECLSKPVEKSRDVIVKEAFKLFLQKNVEKVTVPELEQSTHLCRGAIFYHFKDKEAILAEVIETYFFSPLNIFYPLCPELTGSLEEYWRKKKKHLNQISVWFKDEKLLLNPYFAFFHLAGQAYLYIPSFRKRMMELIDSDKLYWKQVAQSDKMVKTRKLDSDIVGNTYRSIYIGQCCIACYEERGPSCSYPGVLDVFFDERSKSYGGMIDF